LVKHLVLFALFLVWHVNYADNWGAMQTFIEALPGNAKVLQVIPDNSEKVSNGYNGFTIIWSEEKNKK